MFKKFSAIDGTGSSFTAFTGAHHLSLSWADHIDCLCKYRQPSEFKL